MADLPPTRKIGEADFTRILEGLKPQIGNYEWMLRILRARHRKTGWFPGRTYRALRRLGNPRKPYFVAKTVGDLSIMCDYRDWYCMMAAVSPRSIGNVAEFLKQQKHTVEGAYLDVGTNIGIVAATMARELAGHSEVLAFEPVEATARLAAATFALNGLHNIQLIPVAIGQSDCELTFKVASGYSAQASAHYLEPSTYGEKRVVSSAVNVVCRSLDSLANEGIVPEVGLIKLDVQGHELQAILGATNVIRRDRPSILFEYDPPLAVAAGWTAIDVIEQIAVVPGYTFQSLVEGNNLVAFPPPGGEQSQTELFDIYCSSSGEN